MARTATRAREAEVLDLEALITLLSDAYTASYRPSSLKVRRRYRRLIAALTKAQAEREAEAEFRSRKRAYLSSRSDQGD